MRKIISALNSQSQLFGSSRLGRAVCIFAVVTGLATSPCDCPGSPTPLFDEPVIVTRADQKPRTIEAHSVVLIVKDGQVYTSGEAEPFRGDDDDEPRNQFKPIASLSNIREVALDANSGLRAAALDQEGFVWVWGPGWQEIPALAGGKPHIPFRHPKLKDIASIAIGEDHLVALEKSGSVLTVAAIDFDSANQYGVMGNGKFGITNKERTVHRLPGINDAVAVEAGQYVTLVLRSDGTVWGCGHKVMLGYPTFYLEEPPKPDDDAPHKTSIARPTKIAGLKNIKSISVGYNFAVALDNSGQVWGWGINEYGELGSRVNEEQTFAPTKLKGLNNIAAISAGYDFLLALTNSGEVIAQGCNTYGGLGDDRDECPGKQRKIAGLTSIAQISAGNYNAFARDTHGQLFGWGRNNGAVGGFAVNKPPLRLDATRFNVTDVPQPSEIISSGGVKVVVSMDHNDYYFKSEKLQLTIGDSTLNFDVDDSNEDEEYFIEIPAGTTKYSIQGTVMMDEGRKHDVQASGTIVVSDASFEKQFYKLVAQQGLVPTIQAIAKTYLANGVRPPFELRTYEPWSEMELEAFEGKAKVKLSPAYKKAALETGFFSLGYKDSPHPLVSLLPPDTERNLHRYTTTALNTDSESLSGGGEFAIVCHEIQTEQPNFPADWTDWKKHLLVGTAGDQLFLLVDTKKNSSLTSTWTRFLYYDPDDFDDPKRYFKWESRGDEKVDINKKLSRAAYRKLIRILQAHSVAPLASSPTNQPAYINIVGTGSDEPKEGETIHYLLHSDGW